jgi:integrase
VARDTGNLKAKQVDKLVRAGQPGSHYDGRGLRLEIKGPKSAHWVSRYQIDGVIRYFGLGSAFDFDLAQARDRNSRLVRQKLADGIDPVLVRRGERAAKKLNAVRAEVMTFAKACRLFLEQHKAKWDSPKHRAQWENTLRTYAEPVIGQLAVADIDVPLVLKVLTQPVEAKPGYPAGTLWNGRPETANRLRGRVETVLDFAKVWGHRQGDNPAAWAVIGKALPARGGPTHHAAMAYKDVPAFLHELRQREGVAARGLEFLILCAARSKEVIKARWTEIDFDGSVWTVPAERMKSRKEHRIPLGAEAMALLRGLPREGDDGFVFIGTQPGQSLGHTTFAGLLKRMGCDVTTHGFRSSFRDWAGEQTAFPDDVCEAALAHVRGGKSVQAYARGDLFEKRRALMAAWAQFVGTPAPVSATVVPLREART